MPLCPACSGPPVSLRQTLEQVPVCSVCTATPKASLASLFFRFLNLLCSDSGSREGSYHTPPCLPPSPWFLLLSPVYSCMLGVNALSSWGPGLAGQQVTWVNWQGLLCALLASGCLQHRDCTSRRVLRHHPVHWIESFVLKPWRPS